MLTIRVISLLSLLGNPLTILITLSAGATE